MVLCFTRLHMHVIFSFDMLFESPINQDVLGEFSDSGFYKVSLLLKHVLELTL